MRHLTEAETQVVSGAGSKSCYDPPEQKGNNGFGNGGGDGVPGGSDKEDDNR